MVRATRRARRGPRRRRGGRGFVTPGTTNRLVHTGTISGTGTIAFTTKISTQDNFRVTSVRASFVSEKPALVSVSLRGEEGNTESVISPTYSIGVVPKQIIVRQAKGVGPVQQSADNERIFWVHNISGVPVNYNIVCCFTTQHRPLVGERREVSLDNPVDGHVHTVLGEYGVPHEPEQHTNERAMKNLRGFPQNTLMNTMHEDTEGILYADGPRVDGDAAVDH